MERSRISWFEKHPRAALVWLVLGAFLAAEVCGHTYFYFRHDRRKLLLEPYPTSRFTPYGLVEMLPRAPDAGLGIDGNGFVHNGYDRDLSLDRDKALIFLLGGSTVFGQGASSNTQTIAAQLERILNAGSGPRYRVVNAGFPAFNAYQQNQRLEGRILQDFRPAAVIALDGRNDGFFAVAYPVWKPNWQPYYDVVTNDVNRLMRPPLWIGPAFWLPRLSSVAHYLYWAGRKLRPRPDTMPGAEVSPGRMDRAARAYIVNHVAAAARCRELGVPYLVFLQPTLLPSLRGALNAQEQKILAYEEARFVRKGVYVPGMEEFYRRGAALGSGRPWFQDLSAIFRGVDGDFYTDVCHYTDRANRLIAERLAAAVRRGVR
ncbi:MAG: hypothetical protein WC881_07420 [Elusimicrobiota bacterium]|jgi:hypothetical protein